MNPLLNQVNEILALCNGDKEKTKQLVQDALQKVILDLEKKQKLQSSSPQYVPTSLPQMSALVPTVKYNELLRLCGGDVKTAERCIKSAMQKFPDKTSAWAVDKAIYDLERDRR